MEQLGYDNSTIREELFGDSVEVETYVIGNTLFFPYVVNFSNKIFKDTIEVIYEFELDLTESHIHLFKKGMTIFLAQIFLCKKIFLFDNIDKRSLSHFNKLLKILYNIRNYTEGTNIAPPSIKTEIDHKVSDPNNRGVYIPINSKKAVNLISGGKDSAAATILLEKNGFDIVKCFISGFNLLSGDSELIACNKIYGNFSIIQVKGIEKIIDEISEISCRNGRPPLNNKMIPCGRDLLSVLFVLPIAVRNNANYISVGNERETWKNNIEGINGPISINDTQSELAVIEINKIIKSVIPDIHLFSPIAGLTEITILSWLLKNKPEVVADMSSCFRGNWCGRCWKCTRYYLIQRFVGVEVIHFQSSPLQPMSDYLLKFFNDDLSPGTSYKEEILFLLKNLPIQDIELSGNNMDILNLPELDSISSKDLFHTHSASLIPSGFRRKL